MGQSDVIKLVPGFNVSYQGGAYRIKRVIDLKSVLLESILNNQLVRVPINELQPFIEEDQSVKVVDKELVHISEIAWKQANDRFNIIKPIIEQSLRGKDLCDIADKHNIHYSTIYRWMKRFHDSGGKVSSLLDDEKNGGRGKSRLTDSVDNIISAAIETVYLTKHRKPLKKTCEEIIIQCKNQGLEIPHINTVRNRILNIRDEISMLKRYGREVSRTKYEPIKGHFPNANYPLSVVQIDHTVMDIMLVDEVDRKVVGRPWITVAIDVFSRMIVGFYVSFDPPGALATGMCIAHAILPKELYLSKLDVVGEWPCWGVMQIIHLDNAKEFHGQMLERASQEYGIELNWRPVKTPNWGGHIERLIGTIMNEIHSLPGTTFSNHKDKGAYNSEKEAVFTIKEFEKWLVTFIVQVYHTRKHSSIGMSPIAKYNEGVFGSENQQAKGLPSRIFNERKVKLDFMPFLERSVQEYGVKIDHINYYHEVLRKWIHSKDGKNIKKLIFKRDPRDISVIYFFDPELSEYFEIPYRDTSHPPITLWEYKEILRRLKTSGNKTIDENAIFEAYKRLQEIESQATTKTIKAKRDIKEYKKTVSMQKKELMKPIVKNVEIQIDHLQNNIRIKPFEDIDDGTSLS